MDAKQELTWFIVIIVGIGIIWIASGGIKAPTKNSPLIKAVPGGTTTASGGGWFNFLFPSSSGDSGVFNYATATNSTGVHQGQVNYNQNGSVGNQNNNFSSGNGIYYGADNPPGPVTQVKDVILINSVYPSYNSSGQFGGEYVQISAPGANKKKILLTGMLLKSRMTGNQVNIAEGVNLYYSNNLNQTAPIFLEPGQTAYIITSRSPLGYSFRTNKCIGYLNNGNKNYIVSLQNNCPTIVSYPLPARPNAFKDNCLNFLNSIGSCQTSFTFPVYPDELAPECKTFITDRANYSRCVADFSNDVDFLGNDWRIYLARNDSLWKQQREIVDLLDSQGNIMSTYTY